MMQSTIPDEIERYLRTGDTDPHNRAWPGGYLESARRARADLREETACYVSPEYFGEQEPFADFIVHEAVHIFHNCRRGMVGLRETRTREWLLDIDYRKWETFVYSCEAYARVVALASSPAERRRFADQFTSTIHISEELVDTAEVTEIVQAAAQERNGWKIIRKRCEPTIRHQPALAAVSAEIHR